MTVDDNETKVEEPKTETKEPNNEAKTERNQTIAGEAASELPTANVQEGGGFIDPSKLGILNDVSILLTIEIGRATIKIRDLLNLTKDSIIDLNKMAGEPVDVYANGKLISKGNIITANGKYCVRLTSIPQKP